MRHSELRTNFVTVSNRQKFRMLFYLKKKKDIYTRFRYLFYEVELSTCFYTRSFIVNSCERGEGERRVSERSRALNGFADASHRAR